MEFSLEICPNKPPLVLSHYKRSSCLNIYSANNKIMQSFENPNSGHLIEKMILLNN